MKIGELIDVIARIRFLEKRANQLEAMQRAGTTQRQIDLLADVLRELRELRDLEL
jgi:hypothetical protein